MNRSIVQANVNHNLFVYKAKNKKFTIITKVIEKQDKVIIKRNIIWYDHKTQKHNRKVELHTFDCFDDDHCIRTTDMSLNSILDGKFDEMDEDDIEFHFIN